MQGMFLVYLVYNTQQLDGRNGLKPLPRQFLEQQPVAPSHTDQPFRRVNPNILLQEGVCVSRALFSRHAVSPLRTQHAADVSGGSLSFSIWFTQCRIKWAGTMRHAP